MKNRSEGTVAGCLAMVALLIVVGVFFVAFGPDISISWAETKVTLPDYSAKLVYRQKGTHYAMVRLDRGAISNECWIPRRPIGGPINVYQYPNDDDGMGVRLEDRFFEVLVNIKTAKTYLLVRPSEGQLFRGEILDPDEGYSYSQMNGGPWEVKVETRMAEDISRSAIVTNRGQYLGRIEGAERKGTAPPLLRFVPVGEGSEQVIKKE